MCDYSLEDVRTRKARVGDQLVTNDFERGTRGFKSADDPGIGRAATAVCLLPGVELAFQEPVRLLDHLQPTSAVVDGESQTINQPLAPQTTATFIQVNEGMEGAHRDALKFPDGSIAQLTRLVPGQEAVVLTLPAEHCAEQEYVEERESVNA